MLCVNRRPNCRDGEPIRNDWRDRDSCHSPHTAAAHFRLHRKQCLVIKFGNDFPSDVLRVFYSAAESDVGHYDAVLPKASTASTSFVHPKVISPITKVVNTKRKRAEKSEVITSSPYKQKLQESEKKPKPRKRQKTNDNNVEARKAKQTKQKTTSGKTTKAKQTKQKPKDKRKSMKKKSEKQNEDDSDDDNDDCMCLICGELYSDSAAGEL